MNAVSARTCQRRMVGQRRQTVSQLEVQLSHAGEKLYRQAVDFSAPNCFSAQSKSSRKQQSHFNTLIPPSLERCVLAKVCRARACFTLIEKEWKCLSTLCNTHFKLLASPHCVIKAQNSQPALVRYHFKKANNIEVNSDVRRTKNTQFELAKVCRASFPLINTA